jgi:hypothetical protein
MVRSTPPFRETTTQGHFHSLVDRKDERPRHEQNLRQAPLGSPRAAAARPVTVVQDTELNAVKGNDAEALACARTQIL